MANQIPCGPIHHLRLTVTDVNRSREFYTQVLGFGIAVDAPPPIEHAEHGRISDFSLTEDEGQKMSDTTLLSRVSNCSVREAEVNECAFSAAAPDDRSAGRVGIHDLACADAAGRPARSVRMRGSRGVGQPGCDRRDLGDAAR